MAIKRATITKEQAKQELLRIYELLGKVPTNKLFNYFLVKMHSLL